MKKKFLSLILGAAMTASMMVAPAMAAEAPIDLTGVDVENAKVGISIYKFDDNFMTLYRTELVRYLTEDLGFKEENITVTDGKNDQAEQT